MKKIELQKGGFRYGRVRREKQMGKGGCRHMRAMREGW